VPSLAGSLQVSAEQVQWLLASYSLTFGLALVPAGRAGDLRGRRSLFLGGVGLFATGSVTSAVAPAAGVAFSHGTARPSARGTGLALGLCATLVLLSLAISCRRTSTAAGCDAKRAPALRWVTSGGTFGVLVT
jgi:MFS family permease